MPDTPVGRIAYVANANILELLGLQRYSTGAYVNNATVTCTKVVNAAGATVTGVTFPLAFAYVAASNGNYQCVLPATLALVDDELYTAVIDVDAAGDAGKWEHDFRAERRVSK